MVPTANRQRATTAESACTKAPARPIQSSRQPCDDRRHLKNGPPQSQRLNALLQCNSATRNQPRSFDLDACALNHLAPTLFLAEEVAIQFLRWTRHHDQPLVDRELLEGFGLHRDCGGLVQAIDDIARRLRGREQAIPTL